jgi:hypothetical protein
MDCRPDLDGEVPRCHSGEAASEARSEPESSEARGVNKEDRDALTSKRPGIAFGDAGPLLA